MVFKEKALAEKRPDRIRDVKLPRRESYYPSPADWREEILYFLLPDRFSDGKEATRPLLDRTKLKESRKVLAGDAVWRWDLWTQSGGGRWQGGTLKGVISKLGYLKKLGITAIWLGPVFKQRGHQNTYHGYAIQDFLDVDPRLGTRQDLVDLVDQAHGLGLRVILDTIFNHSGANWLYGAGEDAFTPEYTEGRYPFGSWRGAEGEAIAAIAGPEDGVWPQELQNTDVYTRAGRGNLGQGEIDNAQAEHKRTDFEDLRNFELMGSGVIEDLVRCYQYWIALTDCDGFRIDTLKHVSLDEARRFCGAIKEFAANIGKVDFFLVGEIAGGDFVEDRYLDVLERNLNAALDIGEMRLSLNKLAKGQEHPGPFFAGFDEGTAIMGTHRNLGSRHVSILDDHDHVFGDKIRFGAEAVSERQQLAGAALLLFTLGVPCIYAGTELGLTGPEPEERQWLSNWKKSDVYLREALFGPEHPLKDGLSGLPDKAERFDETLPGFGPFGTRGYHCFDENNPVFKGYCAITGLRQTLPALRYGRQYLRPIAFNDAAFTVKGPGEITAWSRILNDEEVLCVINTHGSENRGAAVLVDARLAEPGQKYTVLFCASHAMDPEGYQGKWTPGTTITVNQPENGLPAIAIFNLPPSEVLVLVNQVK